ncbi:MAG: hypothetical protein ACKVT2_04950 [Saprospiraceae bacterium]
MNKLVFSLLIGLLFTACQNTPKTASEAPTTADPSALVPEAPEVVTPESVQGATTTLTEGVKMMEELRKQVDALPAKVKKEKADEIAGMYGTLEGMIEKQTGMIEEIKASSTPTAASATQENGVSALPSPAQMKEYTESAARYAQEAQAIKEALQKLGKN